MRFAESKVVVIAVGVLLIGFLVHIGLGSSQNYYPWQIAQEIFRGSQLDSAVNRIVWNLRLPRACQCVLTGTLLSLAGASFQALFRNPLAEPYIVGASTGAAVGGAVVYVLGFSNLLFGLAMPLVGTATGIATLLLVMALSKKDGRIETANLLLSGVVTSSLLSSVLSLVILAAGQDQGMVLRWLLGSESEAMFGKVQVMFLALLIGFPLLYRASRQMNVLAISEESAQSVGVNPAKTRALVLVVATTMTAVTVGSVGIIGFVGLVSPHIARLLVGVDLRKMLPLTGILGGILVLVADAIAQRGVQGSEIPVGIVTAIIGAPALLVLLRKQTA